MRTAGTTSVTQDIRAIEDTPEAMLALQTAAPALGLASLQPIANPISLPTIKLETTVAGSVISSTTQATQEFNQTVIEQTEASTAAAMAVNEGVETTSGDDTGKDDATIDGNGDGNGQVPPGQSEDEDGNIVNKGGNISPGLNRGNKIDKPVNPNRPAFPDNPGTEDASDTKANKGTNLYRYDELNRLTAVNDGARSPYYAYDTLSNLIREQVKNKIVDYRYNCLNQLVRTTAQNQTFTYSNDKRGNRIAEEGKKTSQSYYYDATNRMVNGTNWNGDTSFYTYNGLGLRVNNTVASNSCVAQSEP